MTPTLNLDVSQVKALISQFSDAEQEDIASYLDSLTLKRRFKKLLFNKKEVPISIEEITAEVEDARNERYK
ncbi:MAG: hypothetical protein N3A62_10170 [Thermodesulfovibrionales bacterium]|nr:hypothetical protein [Thermodesulfovibrionales bacterium]